MNKYIFLLIVLATISCGDFLKESSQDLYYVRSYKDLDEILVGDGYMNKKNENDYIPYIHLVSDETQEYTSNNTSSMDYSGFRDKLYGMYTWQFKTNLSFDKLITYKDDEDWNKIYKHINTVNMVIYEINKQNKDKENEINRICGEAHFLRAAYYFILANLYSKPYSQDNLKSPSITIKNTEYIEDIHFNRNTIEEVYNQIIIDLKKAENLLENIPHKSNYRADITATYTLLGRVYLYMQDWDNSIKYTKLALGKKGSIINLNIYDDKKAFITKDGIETIFSMGPNKLNEYINIYTKGFGISNELFEAYPEDDLRKKNFFYPINNEGYICKKYIAISDGKQQSFSDVSSSFTLRTSELYLNLAEAYMYKKEEDLARDALDNLRKNRVRNFKKTTESGEALINKIRNERKLELCLEGHRWFDLRRYSVNSVFPYIAKIQNTYSIFKISYITYTFVVDTKYVFEMKMDELANTFPIPYDIANFNNMKNNQRTERAATQIIKY